MASRGLYAIATRAPGTVITALIYNQDHQAHVNGRNALFLLSNGQSVAQFQNTTDPGAGGSESFAPNWAGELERLRFTIAQTKQLLAGNPTNPPVWYEPVAAVGFPGIGARIQRFISLTIPNNTLTTLNFHSTHTVELFNTGTWVDGANPTRFTAANAGLYLAGAYVGWFPQSSGLRQLEIGVNGAFGQPALTNQISATTPNQQQSVQAVLKLAAADYVEYAVLQTSGSNAFLATTPVMIGYLIYLGQLP
jgi:hypothetical protein